MNQTIAVSRLGWHDVAAPLEIPHVRGVPVIAALGPSSTIERSWPNRLGHLEELGDRVLWSTELAPPPATADTRTRGGAAVSEEAFSERLAWFRSWLKQLSQHRNVTTPSRPDALASILLTSGSMTVGAVPGHLTAGVAPLPKRLGEFPGGLQLEVTEGVWQHREEYAALVEAIASGGN